MNRRTAGILGAAGGVATIIGAIGTWATYGSQHFAGTDANRGKTVAIAAGVGLVLMLLTAAMGHRWSSALAIIAGAVALGLTIYTLSNINKFIGAPSGTGKGWGIWVAIVGGVILVLAALAATFSPKPAVTVAAPPAAPPPSPTTAPAPAPPAAPAAPPSDEPPATT